MRELITDKEKLERRYWTKVLDPVQIQYIIRALDLDGDEDTE